LVAHPSLFGFAVITLIPHYGLILTVSFSLGSETSTPSHEEYEPAIEDEDTESSVDSENNDSDAESPQRESVAEDNISQSERAIELATRSIQELRAAFGPDRWFHVEPISQDELNELIASRYHRNKTEFVVLPGKVLFGRMWHEHLGLVTVWATIQKLNSDVTDTGRNMWRTFLFNDKDFSDVKLPTSPSGHVEVESLFALIWTKRILARTSLTYCNRVGVCVRVALIDAGYSDGAGFRSRTKGSNGGLIRAIKENLESGGKATSAAGRSGQASLPVDLTEVDDAQNTPLGTPTGADIPTGNLGKRGRHPASASSTSLPGAKRPRIAPGTCAEDATTNTQTPHKHIGSAGPTEVRRASQPPSASGPASANAFKYPARRPTNNEKALRAALEAKISTLEQTNTNLNNRANDHDERLRTQAKDHTAQLRKQSGRFDEQLRLQAGNYDEQLRLQAKLKDEERVTLAKERDAQVLTLIREKEDLKEKYDTLQHTNARLKERNNDLRTENNELLVHIGNLEATARQGGRHKDGDRQALLDRIDRLGKENDALRTRNRELIDARLAALDERMGDMD
jgi:hypothetical protein